MTRPIVVVDTNVVVSSFLTAEASSPPARIVEAMLEARISFLLSIELLAEYREGLNRPAISRRHGLTEDEIDRVLGDIALHAVVEEPRPTGGPIADPGDRHLWDLLAARPDAFLVTGDRLLRASAPPGVQVVSARELVESRSL